MWRSTYSLVAALLTQVSPQALAPRKQERRVVGEIRVGVDSNSRTPRRVHVGVVVLTTPRADAEVKVEQTSDAQVTLTIRRRRMWGGTEVRRVTVLVLVGLLDDHDAEKDVAPGHELPFR